MVYVVERYLPGLSRADLLPRLSRLEPVIEELRREGSLVRYLGSTIVLEDEACFCQFEGSSMAAVTEANRRADLSFDRIVPAVLVQPTHRSGEMSISTSIPTTAGRRRFHPLAAITAIAAVIALTAWAIATYAVNSATRSASASAPTQASVLRQLTPTEREYVLGVISMSPAQVHAAFATPAACRRVPAAVADPRGAPVRAGDRVAHPPPAVGGIRHQPDSARPPHGHRKRYIVQHEDITGDRVADPARVPARTVLACRAEQRVQPVTCRKPAWSGHGRIRRWVSIFDPAAVWRRRGAAVMIVHHEAISS